MEEYIEKIISIVEPEILSSKDELRNACPSFDAVVRRGYPDAMQVTSVQEIEAINALYRERDRLNSDGQKREIDHIVPLFKGGLHCISNLRIISYEEHRKKSASERRGLTIRFDSPRYDWQE